MLPILYRDERIVVVNKPSGLLVHRSPIDRHETRFAVQMLRDQLGRSVYPVHRLDKGTSGALAFALDRETARSLAASFASHEVVKTYLAIVRGWPAETGEIDHPLAAVQDEYAPSPDTGPKASRTLFRRLATVELPAPRGPLSDLALLARGTAARHRPPAPAASPPRARFASDRRRLDVRQGATQSPVRGTLRPAAAAARLRRPRIRCTLAADKACASSAAPGADFESVVAATRLANTRRIAGPERQPSLRLRLSRERSISARRPLSATSRPGRAGALAAFSRYGSAAAYSPSSTRKSA